MSLTDQTKVESFLQQKKEGRISENQKKVMESLREYRELREEPPTAKELFEYMVETRPGISPMDFSSYQPRLTKELKEKDLVEEAGKKPCSVTGRKAATWKEV